MGQQRTIEVDPLSIALASLTLSMVFCRTLIDRGILRPNQVSSLCHEAAQSLFFGSEAHSRSAAALIEEIRKRVVQAPTVDRN